jgi:hypothetical protein
MKIWPFQLYTVANDALGLQDTTTKTSALHAAEQKMHDRNMMTSDW